jgi:CheY-like chemotaxis protein
MNKDGPIVVIEDSLADKKLLEIIFKNLKSKNELIFFLDGKEALDFLNSTKRVPFLIISDINMPKMSGFELRSRIHENQQLALKCVPFLFFSSGEDKKSVEDAYAMSVQGFFRKPIDLEDMQETIGKIIAYWKECIAREIIINKPSMANGHCLPPQPFQRTLI